MTVKELKKELEKLPDDATVHAYEGEGTGIQIRSSDDRAEIAWFETRPI